MVATSDEFYVMLNTAAEHLPRPGSSSRPARANRSVDLLGPEHFCFMQQWGPFRINEHEEMDLFLRRLIALQVQLLETASTAEQV